MNFTTSKTVETFPELTGYRKLIAVLIFIVIAVLGIFGNSLVMLAVLLSRKLRTITNIFVVALAVTDLLTANIQVVQAVVLLSTSRSRLLIEVCRISAAFNFILLGYSIITLVLIAINRMHVITSKPSSGFKSRGKKAIASIIVMFLLVPFAWFCSIYFDGATFGIRRGICNYYSRRNTDIVWGVCISLALIAIIFCYAMTYRHVKQHFRQVAHVHGGHPVGQANADQSFDGQQGEVFNGRQSLNHMDADCLVVNDPTNHALKSISQVKSNAGSKTVELLCRMDDNVPSRFLSTLSTRTGISVIPVEPKRQSFPFSSSRDLPPPSLDTFNSNVEFRNQINPGPQENKPQRSDSADGESTFSLRGASHAESSVFSTPNRSRNHRVIVKRRNLNKINRINRENNHIKAESKITTNMLLIVVIFFACMMPSVITLLVPGQQDSSWITFLVLFSNCCWNPLIYAWKHPDFKHTFICILRGKFSKIKDPVPWLRRRIVAN